jgi:hypothetical protein
VKTGETINPQDEELEEDQGGVEKMILRLVEGFRLCNL